jgi:hypothetical protein
MFAAGAAARSRRRVGSSRDVICLIASSARARAQAKLYLHTAEKSSTSLPPRVSVIMLTSFRCPWRKRTAASSCAPWNRCAAGVRLPTTGSRRRRRSSSIQLDTHVASAPAFAAVGEHVDEAGVEGRGQKPDVDLRRLEAVRERVSSSGNPVTNIPCLRSAASAGSRESSHSTRARG